MSDWRRFVEQLMRFKDEVFATNGVSQGLDAVPVMAE